MDATEFNRLEVADAEASHQLSVAENWPHDLRDWRTMLELGNGLGMFGPEGALDAVGLRFDHGDGASTVGMVIVSASRRGQGVGRRLMAALLEPAVVGRATWLYATEQGAPLYRSMGFEERGATHSFRGELAPDGAGSAADLRYADEAEFGALSALDAEVFGAPRIELLGRLWRNDGRLVVAGSAQRTAGYAMVRGVGRGQQIGPIVADDEALAVELVSFIGTQARGPMRIDVPESASRLCEALVALGMRPLPREPLMVRGGELPGDRDRLFAVASSAYG